MLKISDHTPLGKPRPLCGWVGVAYPDWLEGVVRKFRNLDDCHTFLSILVLIKGGKLGGRVSLRYRDDDV